MARVERVEKVLAVLKQRSIAARKSQHVSVAVGFQNKYALYVHENLEQRLKGQPRPSGIGVYWGPAGQPKFLEEPARQLSPELGRITRQAVTQGATLEQGLVLAGLRLQRESQLKVPVEYGVLKASAFTEVEK